MYVVVTYSDIIKLTAQFVAHNGPRFMDQLMMKEQKNETFDFLRKNHILFTYFTKMVEQYSKVSDHDYVLDGHACNWDESKGTSHLLYHWDFVWRHLFTFLSISVIVRL